MQDGAILFTGGFQVFQLELKEEKVKKSLSKKLAALMMRSGNDGPSNSTLTTASSTTASATEK